jgi:hypothetical protein
MELKNLIETHLDLPRLAKDLDELGHPARLWAVRQWTREDMAILWEATKGFLPVALDYFVPPSVSPLHEVIHHGKNSLPAHTHFQKRFAKPVSPDAEGQLVGFNFQTLSPVTGPGYFVMHGSNDAGEMDIDYTMLPKEKCESWPEIVPNSARLGRFVYYGTVDVMRGISTHVSIGRARRKDGWMDNWFMLIREDPQPETQPTS